MIQTTDISFLRNRKGSFKPLKRLWMSTIGVQSPSTLASEQTDLLKTLPTNLGNWMGYRISPSIPSELICLNIRLIQCMPQLILQSQAHHRMSTL